MNRIIFFKLLETSFPPSLNHHLTVVDVCAQMNLGARLSGAVMPLVGPPMANRS